MSESERKNKDEKDIIKQLNGKTKQMKGIEGAVVYDEGTP